MGKWLKAAFFSVLLIAAGYFFGTICGRMEQFSELLLSASGSLIKPLLWLLFALAVMAIAAGLVAALLRPAWTGILAYILSGAGILLGWQVSKESFILVLIYVLAGSLYIVGVAGDMNERIKLSMQSIRKGQGVLLATLALLLCGSLYIHCTDYIEREGFSIPDPYMDILMEQTVKQVEDQVPEIMRPLIMPTFEEEFRDTIGELFEQIMAPYEKLIPLTIASTLFFSLSTITNLLAFVPNAAVSQVVSLLVSLGIVKVVSKEQEVERLTID